MEFEEIIQLIAESVGEVGVDSDFGDMFDSLIEQGIDLTQYSIEEIRDVLDGVLDNQADLDEAHNVSFGSTDAIDRRNIAKSELLSELQDQRIYVPGGVSTDHLGGLTSYSGQKVEDAINSARDRGSISDSEYKELFSLLKEACRFQ